MNYFLFRLIRWPYLISLHCVCYHSASYTTAVQNDDTKRCPREWTDPLTCLRYALNEKQGRGQLSRVTQMPNITKEKVP